MFCRHISYIVIFKPHFLFLDNLGALVHGKTGRFPHFYDRLTDLFFYEVFLEFLLVEILSTLRRIQLPAGLSIAMWNDDFDPESCADCREVKAQAMEEAREKGMGSVFNPWSHCLRHLPAVCQTKLGPCLVLKWCSEKMRREGRPARNVVIDLITGIPVPETNTLSIYNRMITGLLEEMPPGYKKVISSHFDRDRPIGDDMESMSQRSFEESSKNFVGVKLLSWGPGQNYHVRPGQVVEIEQFQDSSNKRAYIILKSLIKLLHLPTATYMLKKAQLGGSTFRSQGMDTRWIVYNAMITPELISQFLKYVDREEIDEDFIPLTAEGEQRLRSLNMRRQLKRKVTEAKKKDNPCKYQMKKD